MRQTVALSHRIATPGARSGLTSFYLNTTDDWDPAWGGDTLVLDDGGRLAQSCNPKFKDLEHVASSQVVGNYSFLFARTEHSWHGVREIHCPPDRLRRIFIVVINYLTPAVRLRRLFGRRPPRLLRKGFSIPHTHEG